MAPAFSAPGGSLPELGRSWLLAVIVLFIAVVDTGFRHNCHEIFGDIAMQHTQFRVVSTLRGVSILALFLGFAQASEAAGIVHPAPPDPLLDGVPDGPCAALMDGPAYAAGTDSQGHAVVPPDVGTPPVAIPDQVMMPLHAGGGRSHGRGSATANGPYVAIDGRRLGPLVNPPGCGLPDVR